MAPRSMLSWRRCCLLPAEPMPRPQRERAIASVTVGNSEEAKVSGVDRPLRLTQGKGTDVRAFETHT